MHNKEGVWKLQKEKLKSYIKEKPIRITDEFSVESLKAKKNLEQCILSPKGLWGPG